MIFFKFRKKYFSWINPDAWRMSLLGLSRPDTPQSGRGLVLVQIDGFSYRDCERAMKKGHMPFLSKLIRREHYRFRDMYSGVPSNTPAFQGEFFFGKPQCVPAFQYLDRKKWKVNTMYEKSSAEEMENFLQTDAPGLITGGTSYGNIFSGGAAVSHVCASTADWLGVVKTWNPYSILVTFLLGPFTLIRGIFLCIVEAVLALIDFLRALGKKEILHELSFILMRVFVSIMMREIITAHARMDIYRGTRIIHLNYFGYDEQAHRRGPSTRFAYWSLSGIDSAIKKIWKSAIDSDLRHYDVWIYSDHGQETVTPFPAVSDKSIQDLVQEIYAEACMSKSTLCSKSFRRNDGGLSGDTVISKLFSRAEEAPEDSTRPIVTALGPVCNIYFPKKYSDEEKKLFSQKLIEKNKHLPVIAIPLENGKVEYQTQAGSLYLPEDAAQLLGKDHPYRDEVAKDLNSFFNLENRGDLVLFGWCRGARGISFSSESGAHAGFGPNETQAFVLLPPDAKIEKDQKKLIRGSDLRQAALAVIGRIKQGQKVSRGETPGNPKKMRVMSYNVHSCVGMDGVLSVGRIARVIAQSDPDVVALQELDGGRRIKGGDQAAAIARELEMQFHFHGVCGSEKQCFGNAILSRHPMKFISAEQLPTLKRSILFEPRGALWVEVDFYGKKIHILNTHLSIWTAELQLQIQKLLGPALLEHPDLTKEVILCGDFNTTPGSKFYRQLTSSLKEPLAKKGVSQNTWMSQWPIRKLDHILLRGDLQAEFAAVPRTRLERQASDHLPVVADFTLESISQKGVP